MIDLFNFIVRQPSSAKIFLIIGLVSIIISIIIMIYPKVPQESVTGILKQDSATTKPITKKNQAPTIRKQKIASYMNKETNSNSGENRGNIGGSNNTVNNITNTYNLGPQSRKIPSTYLDKFEIEYPNKDIHVRFMAYGGTSGDMEDVKDQIVALLKSKGYNNINEIYNRKDGYQAPSETGYFPNDMGGVTFHILPYK